MGYLDAELVAQSVADIGAAIDRVRALTDSADALREIDAIDLELDALRNHWAEPDDPLPPLEIPSDVVEIIEFIDHAMPAGILKSLARAGLSVSDAQQTRLILESYGVAIRNESI